MSIQTEINLYYLYFDELWLYLLKMKDSLNKWKMRTIDILISNTVNNLFNFLQIRIVYTSLWDIVFFDFHESYILFSAFTCAAIWNRMIKAYNTSLYPILQVLFLHLHQFVLDTAISAHTIKGHEDSKSGLLLLSLIIVKYQPNIPI